MSRRDRAPDGSKALAVILGASRYPAKPAWDNRAFERSAVAFRSYATAEDGLGIPSDRVLDLFGDERDEQGHCMAITAFLARHRPTATDLVVYYVGHGGFADDRTYYLGITQTRERQEFLTTLDARKLARTIKLAFRNRRVYVVLDCCFAAAAVNYFQSDDVAQLAVIQVARDLPTAGTAFLAAASKDDVAIAPAHQSHTIFTTALLRVLERGMGTRPALMSLYDLYEGICDEIEQLEGMEGPAPQIHCPSQPDGGDVSRFPLFPNPAATMALPVGTSPPLLPRHRPATDLRRTGVRRWLRPSFAVGAAAIAIVLLAGLMFMRQFAQRGRAAQLVEEARGEYVRFRTAEAESLLLEAVTADPDDAQARAELAAVLAERGNYVKAQEQARSATARMGALDARGRLWVEGVDNEVNWRLDHAARAYRDGWQRFGDHEAGLRLAHVQTLSGKHREALATLKALGAKVQTQGDPRFTFARALAAEGDGATAEAFGTLQKIAAEYGGIVGATALSQLCRAYFEANQPRKAEASCVEALARFGDHDDRLGRARTLNRQAVILSEDGSEPSLKAAAKLLTQAIEIAGELGADFDKASALTNRLIVWSDFKEYDPKASEWATNDFEAASAIYRRIGDEKSLARLAARWALGLVDSCQYEAAREQFEKARSVHDVALDVEGVMLTANAGMMDYHLGNLAGAQAKLEAALRAAGGLRLETDARLWATHLGKVYMAQDKLAQAEKCFLQRRCGEGEAAHDEPKALELDDDTRPEYALLALEMGRVGQAEAAMREQYERLQTDSDDGNVPNMDRRVRAMNVLARALAARGGKAKLARAWNLIEDAISQSSDLPKRECDLPVVLSLTSAQVATRMGRFDQARAALDQAAERATRTHLIGYRLEALLLQAELATLTSGKDPAARSAASRAARELADRARQAGFSLIERKAGVLARQPAASR